MLLCRLAENAFWLGRYLERAEGLSRAILAYEAIRLDIPGQRAPGWQRLAACAGLAPAEAADLEPAAFVARVILDRQNPSSLQGALHAARENLRRARSLFPAECWHTLNPLYLRPGELTADVPPAELRRHLDLAVAACRELGGHIATGMLREEGYAFFRMGVLLERSDMMLRAATIVADTLIPADGGMPFEDVQWMGLLKSVGAYGTYRNRYHAATDLGSALQLLLFEPKCPRSLAYALDEIRDHLAPLPRNEDPHSALEACRPASAVKRAALHDFVDDMLARLAHASAVLAATYFSPAAEEARTAQAPTRRRAAASATTLENQPRRDSELPLAPVT